MQSGRWDFCATSGASGSPGFSSLDPVPAKHAFVSASFRGSVSSGRVDHRPAARLPGLDVASGRSTTVLQSAVMVERGIVV
jgi:hypothetical protein